MRISNPEIFFPRVIGKIKKVNAKAKPKCMALAGRPLNIPKFNQKGNGEAYQSWNNDQIIAIAPTIFKCNPVRFLVGDKSSLILLSTFVVVFWFIYEGYFTTKKRPNKYIGPFLI